MTRRRAVAVFSLLCALVFSAFAASSVSALGTTAFTCEPVAEVGRQFSDEHCTIAASGAGKGFRHAEIAEGTEIEGTNAKTETSTTAPMPVMFHTTIFTLKVTISCGEAALDARLTNTGPKMKAIGPATLEYRKCTTEVSGNKTQCEVIEPIKMIANISTVVEGETMYVKTEGAGAGGTFVILDFINGSTPPCHAAIANFTFPVAGSIIGTPNGATLEFNEKEPKTTLSIGGWAAEYRGKETMRKKGGNPITFTTTAN